MVMGVFPPMAPPTVPTPSRVLDAAISSQAQILFSVPFFCEVRKSLSKLLFISYLELQSWSANEKAVKQLANISTVVRKPDVLVSYLKLKHLRYMRAGP